MGLLTRFGKVAAATWSAITQTWTAVSQTGAAYVITWTANTPTAGVAATIADGDSPSVAETGQAIQDITTQLNKNVVDIAALIVAQAKFNVDITALVTKQAQLGVDNAAMLAQLNAGE